MDPAGFGLDGAVVDRKCDHHRPAAHLAIVVPLRRALRGGRADQLESLQAARAAHRVKRGFPWAAHRATLPEIALAANLRGATLTR